MAYVTADTGPRTPPTSRCPADADALSWQREGRCGRPGKRNQVYAHEDDRPSIRNFRPGPGEEPRGVSHQESLINPQPGGSCLNWVLGHLTRSRNQALALFGQKPMFPSEELDSYDDNGGKPFRHETAIAFDELKRRF